MRQLEKHRLFVDSTINAKIDSVKLDVEILRRQNVITKKNYEKSKTDVNSPIKYNGDEELLQLLNEFEAGLYNNSEKNNTSRIIINE